MSGGRLRQILHHLQHPQSPHPNAHRGAAVLLCRAELWPFVCQCHQLQEPHEDTHWWVLCATQSVPTDSSRVLKSWFGVPPEYNTQFLILKPTFLLLQERNLMSAPCRAVKSASRNTRAFTNTTWFTRPANRTTATTVGRPTSRSPLSPCTNAQRTTTRSPSRRSRRPTLNPQQVSICVCVDIYRDATISRRPKN